MLWSISKLLVDSFNYGNANSLHYSCSRCVRASVRRWMIFPQDHAQKDQQHQQWHELHTKNELANTNQHGSISGTFPCSTEPNANMPRTVLANRIAELIENQSITMQFLNEQATWEPLHMRWPRLCVLGACVSVRICGCSGKTGRFIEFYDYGRSFCGYIECVYIGTGSVEGHRRDYSDASDCVTAAMIMMTCSWKYWSSLNNEQPISDLTNFQMSWARNNSNRPLAER